MEPHGGYWQPGDPWIGDPPHEHQGWYSIYDDDAATAAVIAVHAAAMIDLIYPNAAPDSHDQENSVKGILDIYPSPSLGKVTIVAALPEGCHGGILELFDVKGRRQQHRIVHGGMINMTLSIVDNAGAALGAGTYIVRLSWNGNSKSEKLVLLK